MGEMDGFKILWSCPVAGCDSACARSTMHMYLNSADENFVRRFVRRHYRDEHPDRQPPEEFREGESCGV